ncbi:MAG: hypothetical protein CFE41_22245 [Burkholderiales bacterium PBB2]|nr:MAG: hypothetical protein CFE41_22245 [Burkholderiales bacterium PBB2]
MPAPAPLDDAFEASPFLLVDDHPVVRAGLAQLLRQAWPQRPCDEADNVAAALAALDARRYALVVLDLKLRHETGLDLLQALRERTAVPPVLVMSMHESPALLNAALKAGARGYVSKLSAAEELAKAVRSLLEGGRYWSSPVLDALVGAELSQGGLPALAPREWQVFTLLAEGCDKPEMATRLGLSESTVETYRQRLRSKLGLADNLQLVKAAVEHFIASGAR